MDVARRLARRHAAQACFGDDVWRIAGSAKSARDYPQWTPRHSFAGMIGGFVRQREDR